MIILLVLPFLFGSFIQKWVILDGKNAYGRVLVGDVDHDGLTDIIVRRNQPIKVMFYELDVSNQWQLQDSIVDDGDHLLWALGDFDSDNQNEFVWGYSAGEYSIWECTGNNSYQGILLQQLPTVNIKDCFSVPDADGDGKMEFVVKGYVVLTARINAFIFEATGDNTYEIIKTFDLFGGHNSYWGGYSDVGDVDGDSIPEIALEGCQTIYIIKAAGNDSFYVWETLSGNSGGSNVRIFDIDGNGLSEIVISGNDETRIYEYQTGIVEDTGYRFQERRFEVHPNPFTNILNVIFQTSTKDGLTLISMMFQADW